MAIEIRDFTVTVPAGTPIATPQTSDISFPPRTVTQVNIRVPPGPRGELGFALATGGVNILPYGTGTWIVTDDEDLIYTLENTIESGAWQLIAYNTGDFDHSVRVYFFCDLPPGVGPGAGGGTSSTGTLSNPGGGGGTPAPTPVPVPVPVPTPVPVPVPVPVVPTPPTTTVPVILPPTFTVPPLLGGTVAYVEPEALLIGVADVSQVWLLSEDSYAQIATQADADALSTGGVAGVPVGVDTHAALYAASQAAIEIDLGHEILSWLQGTGIQGGSPPRRA
jgi:hypothetical protein